MRMTGTMKDKEMIRTLKTLILGIAIYSAVVSVPVLVFTHDKLKCELGLLLGALMASAMAVSMQYTLNKMMYMKAKQKSYMAWHSVGRLACVAGVLLLFGFTGWLNIVMIFVGLFSLKISAYLQPLFIKIFSKQNKE